MKYLGGKNYPLYSDYMKYLGKIELSTIFRLHEVHMKCLGELSAIFRLHEVLWGGLSTIFRLHEVLGENKIIQYIPIT